MLENIDLLFSPEPIRAVAVYPLNGRTKGGDKSLNGNPPGSLPRTRPGPGPAGRPKGATVFPGRTIGSFPIKRKLTRELFKADGMTYIAWIRPQRASGRHLQFRGDFRSQQTSSLRFIPSTGSNPFGSNTSSYQSNYSPT